MTVARIKRIQIDVFLVVLESKGKAQEVEFRVVETHGPRGSILRGEVDPILLKLTWSIPGFEREIAKSIFAAYESGAEPLSVSSPHAIEL